MFKISKTYIAEIAFLCFYFLFPNNINMAMEGKVAAKVFGKDVSYEDICMLNNPEQLPIKIKTCPINNPAKQLRLIIYEQVTDDFIKNNKLKATEEEILELKEYQDKILGKSIDSKNTTGQELEGYANWIEMWKLYKTLFEKYGGRVELTKFGPVPIDAVKELLKEYEKQGKFKIYDKDLEKQIWDYYERELEHIASPEDVDFTPYWKK